MSKIYKNLGYGVDQKGIGKYALTVACVLLLAGCAGMPQIPVVKGDKNAKTAGTGSTAGANSQGEASDLQKCEEPLGTMALVEDTNTHWYRSLRGYGIQSTSPIIRLIAQQSNCFIVVERGRGQRMRQVERNAAESGELRENSNFGKGLMVAADYSVTPTLIFSDRDTGGVGAVVGGLLGRAGAIVGAALKFQQAQAVLTMVDTRSSVQVAAAEGSASGTNVGGLLGGLGSSALVGLSAYTKTPEGKVIVGAMVDAFNNLVIASRNYTPQGNPGEIGTGGKLKVN